MPMVSIVTDKTPGQAKWLARRAKAEPTGFPQVAWDAPPLIKGIAELELPARVENGLRNDNILFVGDLIQRTEVDILRTPNLGRGSVNMIKRELAKLGLQLGMVIVDSPGGQ
jgi:DNA-directed RNA polymerase alpha subunit